MMKSLSHKNAGFTLIEMIVSLGVFSVVVTTAVGAMLMLIATNQRLQSEQSVMTNLAFAVDTMTREMRTGYDYYCVSHPNTSGPGAVFADTGTAHENLSLQTGGSDCSGIVPTGHNLSGISFVEGGDSITGGVTNATRILYFYDKDEKTIKRKVGNSAPQAIVSSGLYIEDAQFTVTGSRNMSPLGPLADMQQPTVTVYIEDKEKNDPSAKLYYLETTVTQRILDL